MRRGLKRIPSRIDLQLILSHALGKRQRRNIQLGEMPSGNVQRSAPRPRSCGCSHRHGYTSRTKGALEPLPLTSILAARTKDWAAPMTLRSSPLLPMVGPAARGRPHQSSGLCSRRCVVPHGSNTAATLPSAMASAASLPTAARTRKACRGKFEGAGPRLGALTSRSNLGASATRVGTRPAVQLVGTEACLGIRGDSRKRMMRLEIARLWPPVELKSAESWITEEWTGTSRTSLKSP